MCTVCGTYLCPVCESEHPFREHVFKSLAFVAEEISESLRVKLVPHERTFESFSQTLRDLQDKYKKCNLRAQLGLVVDMMKQLVRGMAERSQVIDDC